MKTEFSFLAEQVKEGLVHPKQKIMSIIYQHGISYDFIFFYGT